MSNVARTLDEDGCDEAPTAAAARSGPEPATRKSDFGLVLSLVLAMCLFLYTAWESSAASAVTPSSPPCAGTGIVDPIVSDARYSAAIRCVTAHEVPAGERRHPA